MKLNPQTLNDYRQCFSTEVGKRVLGDILSNAGHFDADLKTPEEMAVKNFAQQIIHKLGICKTPDSVGYYVNGLFEVPVEEHRIEKGI